MCVVCFVTNVTTLFGNPHIFLSTLACSTDFWSRFDVYTFILLDFHVTSEQVPLTLTLTETHDWVICKTGYIPAEPVTPPVCTVRQIIESKAREAETDRSKESTNVMCCKQFGQPNRNTESETILDRNSSVNLTCWFYFCSFYFYLVSLFIHDIGL